MTASLGVVDCCDGRRVNATVIMSYLHASSCLNDVLLIICYIYGCCPVISFAHVVMKMLG